MPDFSVPSDVRVLVVPGLHGSGPEHWQTRWQQRYPVFERVEQDDWGHPDLERWAAAIGRRLTESIAPTAIVAHSFGCLATAWSLANMKPGSGYRPICALLVAPADPEKLDLPDVLRCSLHTSRLPCLSTIVGSENDPWMDVSAGMRLAGAWGSAFINAGPVGHINAESGLADWESGLEIFTHLIAVATKSR